MDITIQVYHHFVGAADPKLDAILTQLHELKAQVTTMNAETQAAIDSVKAKLDTLTTTVATTVTELQGLSAQLAAALEAAANAGIDPAVLSAFQDVGTRLDTLNTTLADADVANAPKA